MIAIMDYGMGNLRSVQKALQYIGETAVITADASVIRKADKLILPGVGAFRDAIAAVRGSGMDKVIYEEIDKGKPFLGICLGMQILMERSYEDGVYQGLGIIPGDVVKFPPGKLKIPQIGWNEIIPAEDSRLLKGLPDNMVYFVHSYYCQTSPEFVDAKAVYGVEFAAALRKNNVYATQFHPEKSGDTGIEILRRFGGLS